MIPFPDRAGQDHVAEDPEGEVEDEQEGKVDAPAQPVVRDRQGQRRRHDRQHRRALVQPQRQQFVMNVAFVRQERVAVLPKAVEIHADHVQARYHQRGECNRRHVRTSCDIFHLAGPEAQHAQNEAHGQGARVPHEDLAVLLRVSEHIVIEERDQRTQRCERQHPVQVQSAAEEDYPVKRAGDGAQPRGKAVDAVDQIDRVGDVHRQYRRQQDGKDHGKGPYPQEAVEAFEAQAAEYQQPCGKELRSKLRTVFHPDQVVRHPH